MEQSTDRLVDDAPTDAPEPPLAPHHVTQPGGHRPALWAGVGLVVVGALLLVSQFAPQMQLWRWWPLVVVGIGVRQMFGSRRSGWRIGHLGEGLTTMAIGLVLLGQVLGLLRWDVWLSILRLWPVLLISLGLEIIGKATRIELLRFLGSLVVVAALAYGALVLTPLAVWSPTFPAAGGEWFTHVEPHDGVVTEGTAEVSGAVGRLDVTAGDDLVRIEGSSPYEPVFDVTTQSGRAMAEVTSGEGSWAPMTPTSELTVALDRDVDWDLVVEAGVANYDIDLSELSITALALESGVSNGVLTLGDPDAGGGRDAVPAMIDIGVSAIVVRIPHGEDAHITIDEGLSGIDAEGQWAQGRTGGARTYKSEGFSGDGAYWDVHIDSGVGSITLRYY